jgi:hypothetical protein
VILVYYYISNNFSTIGAIMRDKTVRITEEDRIYHWLNIINCTKKGRLIVMSSLDGMEWHKTLHDLVKHKKIAIVKQNGLTFHTLTNSGKAIWAAETLRRETDAKNNEGKYI